MVSTASCKDSNSNYPGYVYPIGQRHPDEIYDDALALTIGGERIELFHGRGETDDAPSCGYPNAAFWRVEIS